MEETKTLSTGYCPRPIQRLLHKNLHKKRFSVLVCHRRFGKTVFSVNEIIDRSLSNTLKNPQYGYIAPTYNQAKRIAWEYLKQYTKVFQEAGLRKVNESELKVEIARPNLEDKITIYLLGADNPDSLAGIYLDGVILDEYSLMNPQIWTTIIRPALSDRKGWASFIGTPRGQNHFFDIYRFGLKDSHSSDGKWMTALYKASETGIIDQDELDSMRAEMTEEEYLQEMECSFTAALVGSYYGSYMEKAEKENRICNVPLEAVCPVNTAWDLGIGDTTVIWFYQTVGKEVHIIDYIENSGKGLEWYVKEIKQKDYVIDNHYLPHDAEARELGTGRTRIETLRELGLRNLRVLDRQSVEDGINAVRTLLPSCWFDKVKCDQGISALKNYQKQWDAKRKVYLDKPLHDWASNAADSFRYLALSVKPQRARISNKDLPKFYEADYSVME